MKNTNAEVLRALLISHDLLSDHEGPQVDPEAYRSFIGNLPSFSATAPVIPDEAVAFYDSEGRTDGRLQRSGEYAEFPGTQIRLRAASYRAGWKKLHDIKKWLDEESLGKEVELEGTTYHIGGVHRTSGILSLGRTVGSRTAYEFTLNLTSNIKEI
jgi:hypothetical protein